MKYIISLILLTSCSANKSYQPKAHAGHAYIDAKQCAHVSCFSCDCLDFYNDNEDGMCR